VQSTPQGFDYTRNPVCVLHRNTPAAPEAADPQRFFVIVPVVVVKIVVVGFADGRLVVVIVTGAAVRNAKTDTARFECVQAHSYCGGMRSTWPG
jgi:hypothetical protein